MTTNILSLNATFFTKLSEDAIYNNEKIILIDKALKQTDLPFDVITEMQETRLKLVQEHASDRVEFFTKTRGLIQEYVNIINNPLSGDEDNYKILARKAALTVEFLDILKQLKTFKGWSDIEIPLSVNAPRFEKCYFCGNSDINMFEIDDYNNKICTWCGSQEKRLEIGITYKDYDRVNVINKFIYNRVLHFNDCIKQYQGKQNCKVPEFVFQDLDNKFKAHRLLVLSENEKNTSKMVVTRPDPVRYSKIVRSHILMFLKDLKYTKHYENTNLIYYLLTNKRVDDITHLEEKLITDFKELVELYDEIYVKDKDKFNRKNFLNSSYLLYQLLRRHDHKCEIEHFPLLKTIDRKIFHDQICENLFSRLQWKFTHIF